MKLISGGETNVSFILGSSWDQKAALMVQTEPGKNSQFPYI